MQATNYSERRWSASSNKRNYCKTEQTELPNLLVQGKGLDLDLQFSAARNIGWKETILSNTGELVEHKVQ